MAPTEQLTVAEALENNRREFLTAIEGLSDEQAAARPAPDRWSALECIEHVAVVERRFLNFLENAQKLEAPSVDKAKEEKFAARLVNRETRVEAPEPVHPQGRYQTIAEAVEAFNAIRDKSVEIARERESELYTIASEHPKFGVMNGVEIFVFIQGHAARHGEQIREAVAR